MSGFISGLDVNTVTLLSGVLSMIGGALGAFGAYLVARHQINKSKVIDDENRLTDLKVLKLDETIRNINDIKYQINSTDGYVKDVNITVDIFKEQGYSTLNKNNIKPELFENIHDTRKKLELIINKININRWYIKNKLDIDKLYDLRSNYSGSLKKFNVLFSGLDKKSIDLTEAFYSKLKLCEWMYYR